MSELVISITIAIVYALIRAKHDSYINNGPWKLWAFFEGVLIAAVVSVGAWMISPTSILELCFMPFIFGLVFWIIFDGVSGLLRAGKWFYFGSGPFDQKLNAIFKGKPSHFFLAKMVFLVIFLGGYTGFQILL